MVHMNSFCTASLIFWCWPAHFFQCCAVPPLFFISFFSIILCIYCAFTHSELLAYCSCARNFYNPEFLDVAVQTIIEARHIQVLSVNRSKL